MVSLAVKIESVYLERLQPADSMLREPSVNWVPLPGSGATKRPVILVNFANRTPGTDGHAAGDAIRQRDLCRLDRCMPW